MSYTLSQLGWDETFASAYRPFDRSDAAPARVLRADRGVCTVLDSSRHRARQPRRRSAGRLPRDPAGLPCAGDWVVLRRWPDRRITIEFVLPRRTALIRRTADKDATGQVLAANMDTVAVVEPMHPEPGRRPRRAAPRAGLGVRRAAAGDPHQERHVARSAGGGPAARRARARRAGGPGQRARRARRRADPGVRGRRTHPGPAGPVRGGQVDAGQRAGRRAGHARTADPRRRRQGTAHHRVPESGSAAARGRGAGHARDPRGGSARDGRRPGAGLRRRGRARRACRFGDCRHDGEPGCAVAAALADGSLSPRRLASWRKLHREVEVQSARRSVRLAEAGRRGQRRSS